MDLKSLRDTPPWEWPEGAGAFLLGEIRNRAGGPDDRALAVGLAGDLVVIDDALAMELLALVRDPAESEDLRGDAAIALGPVLEYSDEEGFEDDDTPIAEATFRAIQESFQEAYRDATVPKEVRRRVLEASVRAPQPWHAEAVRDASASGDEEWGLTAVFCMQYVQGFDGEILEALGSENEEVRVEAVRAAGARGLVQAWDTVAPLLAPKTPTPLLLAAVEAAPFVNAEKAVPLLERLLASRDDEVIDAVHEALGMIEGLAEIEDEDDDEEPSGPWH